MQLCLKMAPLTYFLLLLVFLPAHGPGFLPGHVHDGEQSLLVPVTRRQHYWLIQELIDRVKQLVSADRLVCNVVEMLQTQDLQL